MKKVPLQFRSAFLIFVCFLITLPVFAIEEDVIYLEEESSPQINIKEKIEESPAAKLQEQQYLLGDFKGFRTKLQEKGIDIQSYYIIDSFVMRNNSKKSTKGTYQGL